MTRINLVLLVALIASSIYLVRVSYDARRLFAEVDHERLLADKQSQATPLRVERVARDKLAMRNATPAVTQYVAWAPAAASGAAK